VRDAAATAGTLGHANFHTVELLDLGRDALLFAREKFQQKGESAERGAALFYGPPPFHALRLVVFVVASRNNPFLAQMQFADGSHRATSRGLPESALRGLARSSSFRLRKKPVLIPGFDGALFSGDWRDALSVKFFSTHADGGDVMRLHDKIPREG